MVYVFFSFILFNHFNSLFVNYIKYYRDSHKQMYNNMVDSDLLELLKEPTIMQIAEKYAKKKEILQSISSEMDTDEINEEETLIQLAGLTLQDAQALKRIVHNCMYLEKEDVPILLLAMKHLDSYEQKSSDNCGFHAMRFLINRMKGNKFTEATKHDVLNSEQKAKSMREKFGFI